MAKTNITVTILGDARSLSKELGGAETKLATFGKKAERLGKTMTATVTLPLVAGGAAAVKWAGELEDSGALAQEVFKGNARDIEAWSKTTAKTLGIAEKDALEYANQFGLALQNIGGMTEEQSAKISKELVTLSADMASAFGTSNEEAFNALRAALTGEYEQLKKYGIVVNETALKQEYFRMTGEKVTGILNAQQKQQAALSLVTQQTSKVQGDFARNIDGTTNSLKVAQASAVDMGTKVGTVLLPAFNSLLSVGTGVVDMFMSLPGPLQSAVVYFGVAAAAAGPLLTVFGKLAQSRVATGVISLIDGLRGMHGALQGIAATRGVSYISALGGVAQQSASVFFTSLNPAMLAMTALVVTAGVAWFNYSKNVERVNKLSEEAAALAEETADGFDTQSEAYIRSALEGKEALGVANDMSFSLRELSNVALTQGDDIDHLTGVWKNYGAEGGTALDQLRQNLEQVDDQQLRDVVSELISLREQGKITDEDVSRFLDSMSEAAQGASKDFDSLRESLIADIKASDNLSGAQRRAAIAAAEGATSIEDLVRVRSDNKVATQEEAAATAANTDAAEDNADATEDQTSALQDYIDTLRGSLDPIFGATDALLDLDDAKREVAEAQAKVTELDKAGKKGTKEYEDATRDLEAAQRGQVRSALSLDSALSELTAGVKDGSVSFDQGKAALARWVREGKITQTQANQVSREMFLAAVAAQNLDRQNPSVDVNANTTKFDWKLSNIYSRRYTPITIDVQGRAVGGILGIGGLGRRAGGGPIIKGTPYIVGEEGPEIVIPEANGTVLPNDVISKGRDSSSVMVGSGAVHLHFHGPVAGRDGERWVVGMIEQAVANGHQLRRLKQSMNA